MNKQGRISIVITKDDRIKIESNLNDSNWTRDIVAELPDGNRDIYASIHSYGTKQYTLDAFTNFKDRVKINSSSMKRFLMIAATMYTLKKYFDDGREIIYLSSYQNIDKGSVPVYGFTGFYVYFKFLMRKDTIAIGQITINHDIDLDFGRVLKGAEKKLEQLKKLPEIEKEANERYKKYTEQYEELVQKMAMQEAEA